MAAAGVGIDPRAVRLFSPPRPKIGRGQLVATPDEYLGAVLRTGAQALSHLLANFLSRPDFIAYDRRMEGGRTLRIQRGLYRARLAVWTVRSRAEVKNALARGESAILAWQGDEDSAPEICERSNGRSNMTSPAPCAPFGHAARRNAWPKEAERRTPARSGGRASIVSASDFLAAQPGNRYVGEACLIPCWWRWGRARVDLDVQQEPLSAKYSKTPTRRAAKSRTRGMANSGQMENICPELSRAPDKADDRKIARLKKHGVRSQFLDVRRGLHPPLAKMKRSASLPTLSTS